jgi:hypothetical protein
MIPITQNERRRWREKAKTSGGMSFHWSYNFRRLLRALDAAEEQLANIGDGKIVEITSLVTCQECNKLFMTKDISTIMTETLEAKILPCGHKTAELLFGPGEDFAEARAAQEMLEWLERNDLIKEPAKDVVSTCGGCYDANCGRYRAPGRDVRDLSDNQRDEIEDLMTGY